MPGIEVASAKQFSQQQKSSFLYRTIWRWHFYAGLFCIPFVLSLSISGTIFLFKPQIDNWIDRPYHNLEVGSQRLSANEQIKAALAAVPNADFLNYQLAQSDTHAVIISVQQNDERILVYVNPYTLEILKTLAYNSQFIRIVRTFHGELLAGDVGSIIIELAGCWAIVLIISGLYLWWPRSSQGAAGIFYPRLSKGKRLFWRDLHAVCGFWVSAFALFLLISGLPWALVWGSAFSQLRELSTPNLEQNWSLSRAQEEMMLTPTSGENINLSEGLLNNAQALNFAHPVELAVSKDEPGIWTLKSQHQNRTLRSSARLNSAKGEVIQLNSFSDKSTLDQVIGIGISAHEGQLFGWLNQLLGLLTTVALFTLSISGFVLWRRRKPGGALGAPAKIPDATISKLLIVTVLVLALLLPLLGLSLICLVLLEYIFVKYRQVLSYLTRLT